MIISASERHCKNCHSVNFSKQKDIEPNIIQLNTKVIGICKNCGYKAKYPHISNHTKKFI